VDFAADFVMDIVPLSLIGTASNVLSSALAAAEMEVPSTQSIQLFICVFKKERSRRMEIRANLLLVMLEDWSISFNAGTDLSVIPSLP
jgi:hypothetical protein